jgi:hypothetical protein
LLFAVFTGKKSFVEGFFELSFANPAFRVFLPVTSLITIARQRIRTNQEEGRTDDQTQCRKKKENF